MRPAEPPCRPAGLVVLRRTAPLTLSPPNHVTMRVLPPCLQSRGLHGVDQDSLNAKPRFEAGRFSMSLLMLLLSYSGNGGRIQETADEAEDPTRSLARSEGG